MKTFWEKTLTLLDKYSILVSALVIYGYFLFTSIDLMEHAKTKKGFFDFVLQFDSLLLMWIIAFVVVQMQKYRRLLNERDSSQHAVEMEMERQRSQLRLLDEVTVLVQESITKPINVVSKTTQHLRKRITEDHEARTLVDHIDFAIARVSAAVNDVKAYETQRIVADRSAIGQHELHR
jgi:ABC-type cobalamin transport system permease subunit